MNIERYIQMRKKPVREPKKVQVKFNIEASLSEAISTLSIEQGISTSALIRAAIRLYINLNQGTKIS